MDKIDEFLGRVSRGEDTTPDDIEIPTIATLSLPYGVVSTSTSKLRVPSGQRVTYEADEDGIVEVIDTYDQDGKTMYASQKMIMPKEIFVTAYKKYIKENE